MNARLNGMLLLGLTCLLTAMPSHAATYSWLEPDWGYVNDPLKWDLGAVPGTTSGDRVGISSGGLVLVDDTHTFGPNPLGTIGGYYSLVIGVEYPAAGPGALQQSGGTITTNAGLLLGFYGPNSYGYYGISGGTLNAEYTQTDTYAAILLGEQSSSVFNQTGGTTNTVIPDGGGSRTVVGWVTAGPTIDNLMNIRGGNFGISGAASDYAFLLGWGGRQNVLNIGGTANVDLTSGGATPIGRILMGGGGSTSVLNLGDVKSSLGGSGGTNGGGGTLTAGCVHGMDSAVTKIVNFHGGILQASTSTPTFDFLSGVQAYVYSEGAILDTHGFDSTVSVPLQDPNLQGGYGVTGITLGGDHGSGYIGEPIVTLIDSGGTGTGATARAIVDLDPISPTFRQITGLVITNPGVGYSGTVTASFAGGNPTVPIDQNSVTVSTDLNESGGLRKLGAGTLTLNADNTYAGLTQVEGGALNLTGSIFGSVDVANTATLKGTGSIWTDVTVHNGGTVSGGLVVGGNATVSGIWAGTGTVYGNTTINTGGTIDPGAVSSADQTGTVTFATLNLQNNVNLHFDIGSNTSYDKILVNGGFLLPDPNPPSPSPITVNVSYTGSATDTVTLLEVQNGYFDPDSQINFVLTGTTPPALDSPDGINTGYLLVPTRGYNGSLTLSLNNPITDPHWTNFAGPDRKYSTAANWGPAHVVPLTASQRAMFTGSIGNGTVPVSLDVSPTLSSMIFDGPGGEKYNITPSGSNFITMNSAITSDWHITALGGEHSIAANIKMAKGTGASAVRLTDGAHLTLSGVLSDLTSDPSNLNVNGAFSGTVAGVLTLSGPSTYTGKTILNGGVLQITSLGNVATANPLGKSSADPANLVLNAGTLRYTGAAGGSTDRGFTVAGNVTVQTDNDATFAGKIVGNTGSTLTINGAGKATLAYPDTSMPNNVTIGSATAGTAVIANGTLALNDSADQGNLWLGDGATGVLNVGGTAQVEARTLLVGKAGGADAGVGGAIHQSSGTVNVMGDGVNSVDLSFKGEVLGHSAYGYYQISGGELNMNVLPRSGYNPFLIGLNAPAVFDQSGGTVNNPATSNILLGVYGPAAMNITGGVFRMSAIGTISGILVGNTQEGVLNIGGGATSAVVDLAAGPSPGTVLLGRLDSQGTVNLGANGVLKTGSVFGARALGLESQGSAVLNFHGGTLALAPIALPFGVTSQVDGLDHAYLYSEGAIIDTGGIDATIGQTIEDPTASGLKRIDVTGGGSGYIGAPFVAISGGSGSGATAVAVMNGDKLDHLVITNPGSGYSPSDNLTVTLSGGGYTTAASTFVGTGATYFATNVGGPLQKIGDGTLTLANWNTYTGLTSVMAGGLKVTNSLSGGVDVYSGATLSGNGTISGDVSLRTGATVAPGGYAPLFLYGLLTVANGANLSFNYDGTSVSEVRMFSSMPVVTGTSVVDFQPTAPAVWPTALTVLSWSSYDTLADGSLIPSRDTIGRSTFRLDLTNPGLVNVLYSPIESEWAGPAGGTDWDYLNASNWTNYVPGVSGSGDLQKQAVFGTLGTAGPVMVNGALNLSSLIFDNATDAYSLSGGAITIESPTTAAAQITVLGSPLAGHTVANALTLNSNTQIRVTGGLTLSGAIGGAHAPVILGDNVVFSGHNTYSGDTVNRTINLLLNSPTGQAIPGNLNMSGTWLMMGAPDQFDPASVVTLKSGEWTLNGYDQTVAGIESAGNVGVIENSHQTQLGMVVGSSVLKVNNGADCTFTGTIRDHGGDAAPGYSLGLTKAGGAVLTLTGALTYTGTTTIEEGTLKIDATNLLTGDVTRGLSSIGVLEVGGAGTTLTVGGSVDLAVAVVGEGNTLVITPAVPFTTDVIDLIVGHGELQVLGAGTTLVSDSITVDSLTIGAAIPERPSSVPEPGTLLLLAFAGSFIFWRVWRKP
jgi:autotransporter-associated beta strand protein